MCIHIQCHHDKPSEQWQEEMCITFPEHTITSYYDSNTDIYLALLQIHSKPIESGLLSPASLLFMRPAIGILPKYSRLPILFNQDDDHYDVLLKRQSNADNIQEILKNIPFLSTEAIVVLQ